MVRLKVKASFAKPGDVGHFNSTMVRLKDQARLRFHTESYIFQFHYGTIKSLGYTRGSKEFSEFQFHYGTIKRRTTRQEF